MQINKPYEWGVIMIAIVCVDDSFGMLFNNRRQSRDAMLNKKIIELSNGSKLWMNSYSYKIFEEIDKGNINVAEDFLEEARTGEFCFVENKDLKPFNRYIERIILFKWNRSYPNDFTFDMPMCEFKLSESIDFAGNSHKKITMEVYVR